MGKRARRGRGRARPGGAPRGGHARGGGGGTRERDGEAWGVAPAARARSARSAQLGDDEGDHAARSASRGQEPTPSPLSTRVEDRDEPAAQARPGWRIETSLRRKGVRGGGSRRACGAPVCLRLEGAAGAGGASEPSSTSIPIDQARRYPSRASPYCPSEATRTTSRDWARRQIYESHLTQGGVRPTTFGVGFRRLSCGGGRPPPALVFNHLTLYAAWCRRCTGREWPGPARRAICRSPAASRRRHASDARARRVAKGLFVDSTQTPHTSSHAPEVVGL